MHEQGVQKVHDYSWIETNGVVHEFLIGDASHAISDEICAKLIVLDKKLRKVSFVSMTEYVLFDTKQEKEHFLGCHSEKLALAFGLIVAEVDFVR